MLRCCLREAAETRSQLFMQLERKAFHWVGINVAHIEQNVLLLLFPGFALRALRLY